MKVLTFISSIDLTGGGPSRSVPILVKGLAEVGVDITLMTMRTEQMNTHALDGTSAKIHILNSFEQKEVEEYVKSEEFDIIQIQSMWEPIYHKLVKIARKLNIPYLITPRGMLEPWSLSQKKWKKKLAMMLYQKADLQKAACIFTTAEMETRHVRDLGIKTPCSVIPNGIETEGYPCRKTVESVKKQILFLSRIHVKKGIELLIDSFTNLYKNFVDWSVVIVGNGEPNYIESLKLKVERLGMQDSIKILPPVFGEAKTKLYQESSLFCLPSYSENFGMVIAEAMSCGVPVITTTNCPWEILNETNTGWCIDLSVDNLEKTLQKALSQTPANLYEMGQRASKLVNEKFNYLNVAARTKELYEWILNKTEKPSFVRLSL